jgi:hypothetical protein
MENSEKWEHVVAVYYRDTQIKPSKQLEKCNAKIQELINQLNTLERQPVKLPKFVTCEGCSSRVSTSHAKSIKCPVCREGDFRPLTLQRKITKLKSKIEFLRTKKSGMIDALKQKELAKQNDKSIKTLVAGWGAC